jgi:hypothetical protein
VTGDDPRLDETLRASGVPGGAPPPLPEALEHELADLAPAPTRSPRRDAVTLLVISLAYGGALLGILSLRRDLGFLPRLWLVVYCSAWLTSVLVLGWLALVPRRGEVMPRWRHAGALAAFVAGAFTAGGLLFARHVPGLSSLYDSSALDVVSHGYYCLTMGLVTSAVPVVVGGLLLRGALPVGARWAGAALGAMGGSLGGLMLHLHCPIADRWHMGLVHGMVVAAAAVIAAFVVPRLARLR